jgi:hypothetical protein
MPWTRSLGVHTGADVTVVPTSGVRNRVGKGISDERAVGEHPLAREVEFQKTPGELSQAGGATQVAPPGPAVRCPPPWTQLGLRRRRPTLGRRPLRGDFQSPSLAAKMKASALSILLPRSAAANPHAFATRGKNESQSRCSARLGSQAVSRYNKRGYCLGLVLNQWFATKALWAW